MQNPRFIIIRRDNIGDLVCTTPLLRALRQRYPDALIAALVNTYNRDVLDSHPVVDAVYAYEKAKHRVFGRSILAGYLDRWRLFRELRRRRFDYAILAGPGFQKHSLRLAKMAGVAHVIGFTGVGQSRGIDIAVPYGHGQELHEVEDIFRLLLPIGIEGPPPALLVSARVEEMEKVGRAIAGMKGAGPVIALHISARKLSQRWSSERFSALGRLLGDRYRCRLLLLWSPGDASNPRHPGDDDKAAIVASGLRSVECISYPTQTVVALCAALAISDIFIGADGGAMHLAAGLGKSVVAIFGDSSPQRWSPWGVASEILQAPSREVADIYPNDVADAVGRVLESQAVRNSRGGTPEQNA